MSRSAPCLIDPGQRQTLAALLTPPGRGAIATVVVDGPAAAEIVSRHLVPGGGARKREVCDDLGHRCALPQPPHVETGGARALRFGRWEGGEEMVVDAFRQDRYEIHCHGGQAVVAMVLDGLRQAGCEVVPWQALRATTAEPIIRREALESLAEATTESTARILLDQYQGALESAVLGILTSLGKPAQRQSRDAEASPGSDMLPHPAGDAAALLDQLLQWSGLGLHLVQPWRVVIAGRPNVGKSSLLNALMGYERAVTAPLAGTTRDTLAAPTAIAGWPVVLTDTAGMRDASAELEREGVRRAQAAMIEADLITLVFDHSQPLQRDDRALLDAWPDALRVCNKVDLPEGIGRRLGPKAIRVSALTGVGVADLAGRMAARLVPRLPAPGCAVPFTKRQVGLLEVARTLWLAGGSEGAASTLRELLGGEGPGLRRA